MAHQTDDLWQGGPWEQPSPVLPAPAVFPYPVPRPSRPAPGRRRRGRRWPWFAGLLTLILVVCLSSLLLDGWMNGRFAGGSRFSLPGQEGQSPAETEYSSEPPSIPSVSADPSVTLTLLPTGGRSLTYTEIYQKNIPSLVSISAVGASVYSTGSGLVLTEDGYLLTNAHVVAGASRVDVRLHDTRVFSASLVGFDADEDLAILKIEASGLTPAEFGDSADLRCGDPVAALGDSLGYQGTFTDGIISALDRELEVDGTSMVLIQTSAAINFGNSGGPLLNQYGQVIGITTVKIITDDGSAESLGFAIPSARVKYVVDQLLAGEEVRSGVFGFTVRTVPVEGGGLELLDLLPESDASAKGLRAGDVITAVNGRPVTGIQDLSRVRQGFGPGDLITLTCLRDGEEFTVDVALMDAAAYG